MALALPDNLDTMMDTETFGDRVHIHMQDPVFRDTGQRPKRYDATTHTAQQFRRELTRRALQRFPDLREMIIQPLLLCETIVVSIVGIELSHRLENLGTGVRRHDNVTVREIDDAVVLISQTPIIKNRKQQTGDCCIGFFNLVKQQHTIGVCPHLGSQQCPETIKRISIRILGHIETNHVVTVAKQNLAQLFGDLGLANAG